MQAMARRARSGSAWGRLHQQPAAVPRARVALLPDVASRPARDGCVGVSPPDGVDTGQDMLARAAANPIRYRRSALQR